MADKSSIEWTDATWNPVTGCTKVSQGCANCYAERLAKRLQAMGVNKYACGFEVVSHENTLDVPLRWKAPHHVFVNSMGDLFHDEVPFDFIKAVFDVMQRASWHRFQILTKRPRRLVELADSLPWADNIWMGVTVEAREYLPRVDALRQTQARVKFLSMEPLLGPMGDIDLGGIDWVIVGGESGYQARPMQLPWATDIRDQCREARVPFFFKQWGGPNRKRAGRLLEGELWDEKPLASGTDTR